MLNRIMQSRTTSLFGFEFDCLTLQQAVARVLELVDEGQLGQYVVTPNLDHAVILHRNPKLQEIYQQAALVLADGWPVISASKYFGSRLPERVAGSDLVPAVFEATTKPLRAYLLGAPPGVAQTAAKKVEEAFPNVQVVGTQCPPYGFENDPDANETAVRQVAEVAPDILVVGLGAPKQELWTYRERHRLNAKVIFCVGATIEFLAGAKSRAPIWCQRYRLEWAHRIITDPRRLARRYAVDAMMLPVLIAKQIQRGMGK